MSFFKNFINQPGTKVLAFWVAVVGIGFTIGMSVIDGQFNPEALYFAGGGIVLVLVFSIGEYLVKKYRS